MKDGEKNKRMEIYWRGKREVELWGGVGRKKERKEIGSKKKIIKIEREAGSKRKVREKGEGLNTRNREDFINGTSHFLSWI